MHEEYYYQLAIDVPIPKLFTYKINKKIDIGNLVIVDFNRKETLGIILNKNNINDVTFNLEKILPIKNILPFKFNEEWLKLIDFTHTYYHYFIGSTAFTSLPKYIRSKKNIPIIEPTILYKIKNNDLTIKPKKHNSKILALWNQLLLEPTSLNIAKKVHPKANELINKWDNLSIIEKIKCDNIYNYHKKFNLNDEQNLAINSILKKINQFNPYLLFGITGSGKTEVYLELIHQVISLKKQILYLVPEINLTPQLISRIKSNFTQIEFIILNSKVSDKKRAENYVKANSLSPLLIIGTRLSIFTPCKNLGLIIVDEEQDYSYKQEQELRYNARDLAVYRAKINNCPIVLGSATPSLQTWYNVQKNKYDLLKLTKRANIKATLPKINLLDTKNQKSSTIFHSTIIKKLEDNLQNKKLSFIYINRRGYARILMCFECGYIASCIRCSARLVLHINENIEILKCHYCGYSILKTNKCPDCNKGELNLIGTGTQKVESYIKQKIVNANIVRIDTDNTTPDKWEEISNQIIDKKIDIIIGTQILAKGHDFDDLNLIIVLNADNSLYSTDYKANENLFNELIQVAGRAGRNNDKAEVIIQTRLINHPFYQYIMKQDYELFANEELKKREELSFPPFVYCACIRAYSTIKNNSNNFLQEIKTKIGKKEEIEISGPMPQMIYKIDNKERYLLLIESANRKKLRFLLSHINELLNTTAKKYKNLKWIYDIDPYEN